MYLMYPPKKIEEHVSTFCTGLNSNNQPVFLNVVPDKGALGLDCFVNVKKRIDKNGGDIVYGWSIWEWPGVMIESEFHAIWKKPNSELIDITPNSFNFNQILFLPDETLEYTGIQVNNIRIPLAEDKDIEEFIDISNKMFDEINKGDLKYQHGAISVDEIYLALQDEKKNILYKLIKRYIGPNSLCPCGSKKKNKKCCNLYF